MNKSEKIAYARNLCELVGGINFTFSHNDNFGTSCYFFVGLAQVRISDHFTGAFRAAIECQADYEDKNLEKKLKNLSQQQADYAQIVGYCKKLRQKADDLANQLKSKEYNQYKKNRFETNFLNCNYAIAMQKNIKLLENILETRKIA